MYAFNVHTLHIIVSIVFIFLYRKVYLSFNFVKIKGSPNNVNFHNLIYALKKNGWNIICLEKYSRLIAERDSFFSDMRSHGEILTVVVKNKNVYVNSRANSRYESYATWGRNDENIKMVQKFFV